MRKSLRFAVIGLVCLAAVGMVLIGRGLAEGDGLIIASPQLVTSIAVSQTTSYIYQYGFSDGRPTAPWISGLVGDTYGLTGSGDIDNDGVVEVYAVNNRWIENVKIDRKTTYAFYCQDLTIYDAGAFPGAVPSLTIQDIRGTGGKGAHIRAGGCVVANVDGDPYQELVVQYGSALAVYQLVGEVFAKEWETPDTFEYTLNGISVGNVDDDAYEEIVAGNLMEGAPVIFDFDGAGFEYRRGELCTIYAKGTQGTSATDPELGDLDNDGRDEIVTGGRNYRVMLWDYDQGEYKLIFTSPSLGYLSYANIGDFGGNAGKAIVAGNMGNTQKPAYLWIFAPEGSQFVLKSKTRLSYGAMAGIEVGDLDADTKDEVIVPGAGVIKIYDFVGADLTGVFSEVASVAGGPCEIR